MSPRLSLIVITVASAVLLAVGVYPRPEDAIEITYVYSTDFAPLIEPQLDRFNDGELAIDGQPVHVTGIDLASGDAMTAIQVGNINADAWTPAATVWGSLYRGLPTDVKIRAEVSSLANSPQVIAMWKKCALELGWSEEEQPSWQDVVHLAKTHGKHTTNCLHFALGGTDPNKSTSGLFAVASWYDYANGDEPLSVSTLNPKDPSHRIVRRTEHAVVHFWDTSTEVMKHICQDIPNYVGAIYLQENTLVTYNNSDCLWKISPTGMVAIYPSGGTYVADYPFYSVIRPDSPSVAQQAAGQFGIWLRNQLTPAVVGEYGFRTAEGSPEGLVDIAHGALPLLPRVEDIHPMLSERLAALLQEAWRGDCGNGECHV